jgi:hypothetical protein
VWDLAELEAGLGGARLRSPSSVHLSICDEGMTNTWRGGLDEFLIGKVDFFSPCGICPAACSSRAWHP